MNEKENLRQWISTKVVELKKELDNLPDNPNPEDLYQYESITMQLLRLAQMRAKHFPPAKDPDPRFKEILY